MFPSNILVVLSQECEYRDQKDKSGGNYLLIPRKYGNISVIDGQHRLFSYANDEIKSQMGDDCKIIVTGVKFKTDDHKLISKSSAQIFIEINSNQTKIEISHLDHISYELGNDDPKVIATRILVEINNRQKFNRFFDIKSDKSDKLNKKMVETKTIINEMKRISNLRTIQRLQNARSDINKKKKTGYESLFNAKISELSSRESLLEKGVILFERYFNLIFKIFKYDKPKDTDKSDISTSFSYANFWGGWVQLLALFIDEGLNWESVEKELEKIKRNVMELLEVADYQTPLFYPKDRRVPSSHRPGESCKFLHYNREKSVSVQDLRS